MTYPVKNISISINSPNEKVYQYVSNAENFPEWLAFVKKINKKSDTVWNVESDLGNIEIQLCTKNEFGIVDHIVTLPDGSKIKNILRVIENSEGSEVIFTLFHLPEKTEKEFNNDADLVRADLKTLKILLEKS